jgi:hypothetical protein
MGGTSLMRGCRWPTGACLGGGRVTAAVSLWLMPGLALIPPASLSVARTIEADPSSKVATTIPAPDSIVNFILLIPNWRASSIRIAAGSYIKVSCAGHCATFAITGAALLERSPIDLLQPGWKEELSRPIEAAWL